MSVLWAGGDEATRTAVLEGLDEAVAAGLRYLVRHALAVRVRGRSVPASGVVAADYLHTTSRALEPQLHHHVVVANLATGPDGTPRAIDARLLFRHARTASYVAAAELRHQLTTRLGVTWTPVHRGIAEVEGVPKAAMAEMSTRAKEIEAAVAARGAASSRARQVAAWDTRAAKELGVDTASLFSSWDDRLAAAGYGPTERVAVLAKVSGPGLFDEAARAGVVARLLRVEGITEHEPVFDRRAVVQRLAELAGERLSGDAVDALAEAFLDHDQIVALAPPEGRGATLRREDGAAIPLPGEGLYSTKAMLALERRALLAYSRARRVRVGVVPDEVLAGMLAEERFARLSHEQRAFVAHLTTSGIRIQAGVGAAGTGKTTALSAAVAAWEAAGYRVLGAAVGGTQAIVLGEETGIEARTVASLLARTLQHGDTALVDDRTVVLVDEASLVSTKDFVALARLVEERGASLRLVGDPAQHGSVEAGGVFAYLVKHFHDDTPALTHLFRQQGPEMEQVRTAVSELREGKVVQALERLAAGGRIFEAESGEEAYEMLADAWYAERQRRLADPSRRRSPMTAERHADRRELNRRARERLAVDGTLHGPELTVAGLSFQAGDEVVARIANRTLRADRSPRGAYVRNGSVGRVIQVCDDGLVVDFERWGRVRVPRSYLATQLPSGAGPAMQHAYVLTTYTAQGETFASAAPLLTDASSREGVYVALTRARGGLDAVAARRSDLRADDGVEAPILRDDTGALEATARRLQSAEQPRLATEYRPARLPSEHPDSMERGPCDIVTPGFRESLSTPAAKAGEHRVRLNM